MTDKLIPDVYAYDGKDVLHLNELVAAGDPWCGIMLKATDGLTPDPVAQAWFRRMWRAALALDRAEGFWARLFRSAIAPLDATRERALVPRLGRDWFVFAYHYWLRRHGAREQALRYLVEVERAGGWAPGTTVAVVDAEEGQNAGASAAEVEDGVSTFAEVVREETGRKTAVYCGWWVHDLGIKSRMGCDYVWPASYTPRLDPSRYAALGFKVDEMIAWQYCGDGDSVLAGYPKTAPGLGPEDISAITLAGGGEHALEVLRSLSTTI